MNITDKILLLIFVILITLNIIFMVLNGSVYYRFNFACFIISLMFFIYTAVLLIYGFVKRDELFINVVLMYGAAVLLSVIWLALVFLLNALNIGYTAIKPFVDLWFYYIYILSPLYMLYLYEYALLLTPVIFIIIPVVMKLIIRKVRKEKRCDL